MPILRPEEVATAAYARWALYGANGNGKTWFLRSIPPTIPTLVISADQENVKPLMGLDHIRVWKAERFRDLLEIYQLLKAGLADPEVIAGRKRFFRLVAFDTGTRMQGLITNQIVGYDPTAPGVSPEEFRRFITEAPKSPRGWEAWQQIGALWTEWQRYYWTLPLHVISLYQEVPREPKFEGDSGRVTPAVTPYALTPLMEGNELVGYLHVALSGAPMDPLADLGGSEQATIFNIPLDTQEERRLLIGKHPHFLTKGPTHQLGYVVQNPTWEKLAPALGQNGAI